MSNNVMNLICDECVIPATRTIADYKYALANTTTPGISMLFGDIITLPELLSQANEYKKRLLLHVDLLDGVGKDKVGIKYLARLGVQAIITTKPQLGKVAREEGMIVIQRLFLMDSDSVKTGINLLRNFKPDALEVLPVFVPAAVVKELFEATGLPILAGGLARSKEDVINAIRNGISAVSTSKRELWNMTFKQTGCCRGSLE